LSFVTVAVSALTLSLPAAASAADAPLSVITEQGLELRADERVFVLFAALNAAGYADETERKGPPLRAPVFHPIRDAVRDELRKVREQSAMAEARKLFEDNPAEVEIYLEAALADEGTKLSADASKLKGKLDPVLARLGEEAQLEKLFDGLAVQQRDLARALKERLERDFAEAQRLLGDAELRAPLNLIVVPNPLDAHGAVRRLVRGDLQLLVVGPELESVRRVVLEAALAPSVAAMVTAAYPNAKATQKAWDQLKGIKRLTARWPTGEAYFADALTGVVSRRVRAKVDGATLGRDSDEEFAENQAQAGQRWARAALRILELQTVGQPLKAELPKLISKVAP
jgi:hypothetical protein